MSHHFPQEFKPQNEPDSFCSRQVGSPNIGTEFAGQKSKMEKQDIEELQLKTAFQVI